MNPSACSPWTLALPRPLLLAVALGVLGETVQPMAAGAVEFPRPGVVCDAPRQVCYDKQGASSALTRLYYGPGASNRLLAQLSGSLPQREFQFSGGQLCDTRQQICWEDGWRRRVVSPQLTRQFFAASPNPGPSGELAAGPAPSPQPPAGERMCQLVQRGVSLFSGGCKLSRQSENFWQYYVVQMDNGKQYRFQRRANALVLRDATGLWPVVIADRGATVQFRWANLLLNVNRPIQPRGGSGVIPPSPTPRSTGETSQDLLDNFFQ